MNHEQNIINKAEALIEEHYIKIPRFGDFSKNLKQAINHAIKSTENTIKVLDENRNTFKDMSDGIKDTHDISEEDYKRGYYRGLKLAQTRNEIRIKEQTEILNYLKSKV